MNSVRPILLITAMLSIFFISSCEKKESNEPPNKRFLGTYNGNDCKGNPVTNLVLNAGSDNSSVAMPGTMGIGSCERSVQYRGTVSGNTLTFPTETVSDGCGNSAVFWGSGSVSGNTLSLTLYTTYTNSSGATVTESGCFSGSK